MTKRKHRSAKERARLFNLFDGKCYLCNGKIDATREAWEIEHVIPLAQDGDDEDHNLQLAHAKCHKAKTAKDAGDTARAKRREARYTGAHVPKSSIGHRSKPQKQAPDKLPVPKPRNIFQKAS